MVAKAFRLDNRIAASDGNGDGNMKGVCAAGACGRAGYLVDGENVAGTLESLLHEHVGGVTVPVYGTTFEFVHAARGADDRGFVSGWESEPACWAADGQISITNVTIYGVGLGWAGPVDVSSREFAQSSMAGGGFVSDWVAKTWLAADSHPFEVDISVD